MNKEKNSNAIARILVVLAGFALLITVAMIGSDEDGYTLNIENGERVAMTRTQYAVAASNLDNSGAIDEPTCSTLGQIAKNFNDDAGWFSSCTYTLYGSTPDTRDNQILKLSDGDYCATFTLNQDSTVLTDYHFAEGICGDARIGIE